MTELLILHRLTRTLVGEVENPKFYWRSVETPTDLVDVGLNVESLMWIWQMWLPHCKTIKTIERSTSANIIAQSLCLKKVKMYKCLFF